MTRRTAPQRTARSVRHRRDAAGPAPSGQRPDGLRRNLAPGWTATGLRLVAGYCLALAGLGAAVTVWPVLAPEPAGARVLGPAGPGLAVDQAPVVAPSAPGRGTGDPDRGRTGPAPAAPVAPDVAGAAFRPGRLVLPSGRDAVVLPAGVHEDGSMVIPEDPSQVAWWDGGALAGEPFGSVVVAGHVDSRRYGVGFMAEVRQLREGDVVELSAVVAGRPQTVRYRVDSLVRVAKARLAADADPFRQDTTHRLVLITCGGPYDRVAHRYPDNLVATASPVQ